MRKTLYGSFVVLAFVLGWFASQHYRNAIPIPTGTARLEIPRDCKPRLWMNGIEIDCKNGATIYYVSKLEHASPQ